MLQIDVLAAKPAANNNRAVRTVALIIGCAVVYALALAAIRHYSFNWPHNDDFEMIDWPQRLSSIDGLRDLFLARNGSHPIGFQAVVYALLFKLIGVNFLAGIILNSLVILIGSVVFSSFVSTNVRMPLISYSAPIVVTLILFHPVQFEHLTWAFEFGWFAINTIVITNSVLIERDRERSLVYAVPLALIAMFSSAHGSIVWLCAAVHYLLVPTTRRSLAAAAMMLVGFALNAAYVLAITPSGEGVLKITSFVGFASYVVSIFGAVFGIRDQHVLWAGGALILACAVTAIICGVSTMRKQPLARVGAVLTVGGIGFLLTFIKGRFQYGLPWALFDFHMGPMFAPLLLGEMAFLLSVFTQPAVPRAGKASAAGASALLIASLATSAPYASERGHLSLTKNSIAMYVTCHDGFSDYLIERENIASGYIDTIKNAEPSLRPLCRDKVPKMTAEILSLRDYYSKLADDHPHSREAIETLWEVYASHQDLLSAFPPRRSDTPSKLLTWAVGDARGGGLYEPSSLGRFRNDFLELGRELTL